MKFGKSFQETLSGPGIPPEWRQTAIEYRKLKKVINKVAKDLAEMGLTNDVLKDLLQGQAEVLPASSSTIEEIPSTPHAGPSRLPHQDDDDDKDAAVKSTVAPAEDDSESVTARRGREIDWDDSSEEETRDPSLLSAKAKGKRRSSRRRATASYELGGTSVQPEPRIRLVFESASSTDTLSSTSDSDHPLLNPSSPSDSASANEGRFTEIHSSEEESQTTPSKNDKDDDESSSQATNAVPNALADAGPKESALLKRMYGLDVNSDDEQHDWASLKIDVEGKEETPRRNSDETVRWENLDLEEKRHLVEIADHEARKAKMHQEAREEAAEKVVDAGMADDEGPPVSSPRVKVKHRRHRRHRKEIFIPLTSETEFLTLLAQALDSLAALQVAQKKQFAQSVQLLAREVSNVSSPSRPKTDLYVWREIFSLWVEAQIFESEREKDRGERSVEDAEAKLDWFVNQVAKRKLGKQMKHKDSRIALDKFIGLNVQLLDMKRFQLANEEAARKILKKHDKRTALTASLGFPKFIAAASSLSAVPRGTSANGSTPTRVLVLPGFPSLPHVLLSTMTSQLLPIIPQLEDYECLICGDVAFKPIKLDCGHKFCVRCLVKMQKRAQNACPQCRQPVVLRANAKNLDTALETFLEMWFPKEVKAKEKANHNEAAKEELEAMGLKDHKCVIQ
ncbi:hypothetical protein T439DRAFT_347178 [Meredithblackwellia eburnea MCA 4105]